MVGAHYNNEMVESVMSEPVQPDYTVEECLQLPKAVRQVTSAPIRPPSIGYREQGAPLGLL